MADPFLKFYTSDWRSDPALRMCSLAARGVWIELICLMHEATPYGQLLIKGHPPTDAQLGVLVGAPTDQIPELIGELEAAGVFSRTRTGVIYSRKMSKMAKKAATARKNGQKGGNPSLRKEREISPSVNPPVKDRDKPHIPEARVQIKKRETDVSPKKERSGSQVDLFPDPAEKKPKRITAKSFPEFISQEHAQAILDHRRGKKAPVTPRWLKLFLGKMEAVRDRGGDPNAAIDLIVDKGWQGFEPDWFFNAGGSVRINGTGPTLSAEQRRWAIDGWQILPSFEDHFKNSGLSKDEYLRTYVVQP